jgi:hypothetical protein
MSEKLLACIMAYYPGPEFERVCRTIAASATYLVIIDNSPDSSIQNDKFTWPHNSFIFYNKNNGAVAGALNIALAIARKSSMRIPVIPAGL